MKINNVKDVSGLITFISENTAWSPVTVSNVINTSGYRKNGGLGSLKQLLQTLTDCAKHGADCGFSGFIYCSDTVKFFKDNRKDIVKNLEHGANETGIDIL
jgi:hypothetical protein